MTWDHHDYRAFRDLPPPDPRRHPSHYQWRKAVDAWRVARAAKAASLRAAHAAILAARDGRPPETCRRGDNTLDPPARSRGGRPLAPPPGQDPDCDPTADHPEGPMP